MTRTGTTPGAEYPPPKLLIDGSWVSGEADDENYPDVVDPATGGRIGRAPGASDRQVEAAITAAQRTFGEWSRQPARERAEVLLGAADSLERTIEADARTMTLEHGKTLAESRAEMTSIIELFRWYAEQAERPTARMEPGSVSGGDVAVERVAIGPVAILTPWNFPASLAARKHAAAFAVGCTAVVKPPPETPASFLAVARALAEAGMPDGVLNVVNGDPVRLSRELVEHPSIRTVSFTGSTPVGREIARLAAGALTRVTLELGGHAPVIVTEDVDVAAAAQVLATTKYRNSGQVCISPTRFLVQRSVYEEFVDHFARLSTELPVGPGLDTGSRMGPLAVERRRTGLLDIVEQSVAAGATLRTGGSAQSGSGWFVEPTVLTGAPTEAAVMNEKPFGPVAVINPYDTDENAIAEANRLPVGLAAYVFTRSEDRARRLVSAVEAGTIGVNTGTIVHRDTPLSGIKDSGYGSDGGLEGMHEFQHVKAVSRVSQK